MTTRVVKDSIDRFIGCDLPLNKNQFGYFSPTIYTIDQARANLKNLILTNKGERLMQPEFGCDIYGLLFEQIDPYEIVELVKSKISTAVKLWLPQIIIKNININEESLSKNLLQISISFLLKNDDVTEELTFTIYQG